MLLPQQLIGAKAAITFYSSDKNLVSISKKTERERIQYGNSAVDTAILNRKVYDYRN